MTMATEEKITLKVGDILYGTYRYSDELNRIVIERVTETQAKSKNWKFKKEQNKNWIRAMGGDTFNTISFQLETDELKNLYNKQRLVSKLVSQKWAEYPLETLQNIVNIITPF